MSTPEPVRALRAPALDLLAQRMLFDAVLAIVSKALERHGFSEADRKDLAQEVAIAAFRRHLSYRAERGSPGQWLSGIVRREVKRFLREQNRQPWFAAGDELPDAPDATSTPEDEVSRRDLAEHVFGMLPPEERRVVILVEIDHLTFREVAERERISPSTAYERHQRGMAALRAAAERSRLHAVLPLALTSSSPGSAPPDPAEEAWRRAVVELGLDDPSTLGPPESRPFPTGDSVPASGRRRTFWIAPTTPPKLGAIGAIGLGGLVGALMIGRCSVDPARDEPPILALGAAPLPIMEGEPASLPEVGPASAGSSVVAPASAETAPRPAASSRREGGRRFKGAAYEDRLDAERALLLRGRRALVAGDLPDALAWFAEHARRFPRGQSVGDRERLWSEACARVRRTGGADARCDGRPSHGGAQGGPTPRPLAGP